MLIALATSAVPKAVLARRVLEISARDLAHALVAPLACAVVVGVALGAIVAAVHGLGHLPLLAVVVAVGFVSYTVAAATLARDVTSPIVGALRERLA
jgi:hypothetical protein